MSQGQTEGNPPTPVQSQIKSQGQAENNPPFPCILSNLLLLGQESGRLRLAPEDKGAEEIQCPKHSGTSHKGSCGVDPMSAGHTLLTAGADKGTIGKMTKEVAQEAADRIQRKLGACPLCMGTQSYDREFPWGKLAWPSQRFASCLEFQKKTPEARGHLIESHGGRRLCTGRSHLAQDCFQTKDWGRKGRKGHNRCTIETDGERCGRPHHNMVHGSNNVYCQSNSLTARLTPPFLGAKAGGADFHLFEVMTIALELPSKGKREALVMVDPGSTHNFITHKLAEDLQLEGMPMTYHLRVINSKCRQKGTSLYKVTVVDNRGQSHDVEAVGIDSLTEVGEAPEPGS